MCWRCRADAAEALVCPSCEAPQPLARDVDLFQVLGLPRSLVIDGHDLEERYHAASRAVHPDRHQTSGTEAGAFAVAASAAVNRAYRTLRDPIARARYWLELHAVKLGDDNNRVPPDLAALVFETQEKVEELASAPAASSVRGEVETIRAALTAKLTTLEAALGTRVEESTRDGVSSSSETLADLKGRLSEISYLRSLLDDVDEALGV